MPADCRDGRGLRLGTLASGERFGKRHRRHESHTRKERLDRMRAVVIDGHNPTVTQIGWMLLWVSATLISGVWVFLRYRPRFAEEA